MILKRVLRTRNRDISVGIVEAWTAGVRFQAGIRDFSLVHSVQTSSGAHPASYPMSDWVSFLRGKVAGA
jgi:hypothetical protein